MPSVGTELLNILLPGPPLTPAQKRHGPSLTPGPDNLAFSQSQYKSLSDLVGATGWAELVVRGLECLAGAALILLGLQALTGGSGDPVRAVRRVVP